MQKLILIAAAALLATQASAGVRIETITRNIETKVADGGPQVVMVQDGWIRTTNAKHSNGIILKDSKVFVLDDQRKTYMEMDKATMKKTADQAGAAMKQLQDKMKNMPPEQRAQMEKMLGANMPGMMSGKTPKFEVKDTGKSDTSEGRKCRLWHLLKDGVVNEELCVVPFSSMPGKEDFQKTFRELAESFEGMTSGLPGAGDSITARNSIDGYPVRIRPFNEAGKPRGAESVVTKWVEESLPGSTFEIPAGYTKKEMPALSR